MPKTRIQKEEMVAKLSDRLERSASVVLVSMTAVKVSQVEMIRDALFTDGSQLQVPKNRLLQKVLEDQKLSVPAEVLDQPVGLVFSYSDPVSPAKTIATIKKEVEALQILGGIMDGKYLSASEVEALASLPSREQLLGQLVSTIASPLSGLVNVLQGNIRGLVTVLSQVRDQKA